MPRRQHRHASQNQEEEASASASSSSHRKTNAATVRTESGLSHHHHHGKAGIRRVPDSADSVFETQTDGAHTRHTTQAIHRGGRDVSTTRFPKLEDCAHFHYDFVDFGTLQVALCSDEDGDGCRHGDDVQKGETSRVVRVSCGSKTWRVRRTLAHFASLDHQLHRCIFDRKFSQLPPLLASTMASQSSQEVDQLVQSYLCRFSELAGPMLNCGSILNWLEMDNRGNRMLALDTSGINTPAIAAAHAVKRYIAQAADEISLQVGDIVSVIDMSSKEDKIWWRGKRGFEVGFFPGECVEVIGDKIPISMTTMVPMATGSLNTSPGNTLAPLSTPATARKPCETTDGADDSPGMIRRQGKLMSFLRTFFSTRPARNQLKQTGIVKERVFGCDLGEHLLNSGHDVPLVLKSCTEVIETYGIVDGIYRLSGVTSNIQKLRVAFDEDRVPELMESSTYLQDIHSISSLLKMYFRELPNPLLTYQLYHKFAEAVKDEDNRLLRIHDVVQQLPPPHYRTLEYLIRHLARVASHSASTGMHCKNLAIVWAPNLLRSKELEMGGGAAALRGVGIQAVVTECLICYCDLLFNDNMPAYNSPQSQNTQKRRRPRSLAISTPTRLLSLEEARERAFMGGSGPGQRYVEVGGGPASLPPTFHTVIDLPGHRKKNHKDANKGKKSPTGWKSIFHKPRAGSIKKSRKGSTQEEDKIMDCLPTRALTEDDVHTWKRRLRSAKSAESLVSVVTSAHNSIINSPLSTGSSLAATANGHRRREERGSTGHKRSLSSDASPMGHRSHSPPSPPLHRTEKGEPSSPPGTHRSRKSECQSERRQSFVRGDSTRKAMHHHRRTPSAPNTPRDRSRLNNDSITSSNRDAERGQQKASSQPHLDSISPSPDSESSWAYSPLDAGLGIDIDAAIKARLQQMALQSQHTRSGHASPRSPPDAPPPGGEGKEDKVATSGRVRERSPLDRDESGVKDRTGMEEGEVLKLKSSPGSHRRFRAPPSPEGQTRFFVSRYHDYAEIMSSGDDEDEGEMENVSGAGSSTTDMQELVDKLDSKLSSAARLYLSDETHTTQPADQNGLFDDAGLSGVTETIGREGTKGEDGNVTQVIKDGEDISQHRYDKVTQVTQRVVDRVPARAGREGGVSAPRTQVVRRRAEWIPSDGSRVGTDAIFPDLHLDNAAPPLPARQHHSLQSSPSMQTSTSVSAGVAFSMSVPPPHDVSGDQDRSLSPGMVGELSQSVGSMPASCQDAVYGSSTLQEGGAVGSSHGDLTHDTSTLADRDHGHMGDQTLPVDGEGYGHGDHPRTVHAPSLHIPQSDFTGSVQAVTTTLQETHFPTTPDAYETRTTHGDSYAGPDPGYATIAHPLSRSLWMRHAEPDYAEIADTHLPPPSSIDTHLPPPSSASVLADHGYAVIGGETGFPPSPPRHPPSPSVPTPSRRPWLRRHRGWSRFLPTLP